MKRIIFFDGDGTLWYPKKTKYSKHPVWVYKLPGGVKKHNKHLIMIPSTLQTIKKLKKKGIILIILSTHPHPPKEADVVINQKIKHFKLDGLFNEVHATRKYHGSKGKYILRILKRYKISKKYALMVGDSYEWDYKSAKSVGIDSVLIGNNYGESQHIVKKIKMNVKKISEILKYVY